MFQDYLQQRTEDLNYQDRQLPSPMRGLATAAFSLAAFMLVHQGTRKGAAKLSSYLSRNLPRLVRSIDYKPLTRGFRATRINALRLAKERAAQYGWSAPTMDELGIAGQVRGLKVVQRGVSAFRGAFQRQIKARHTYLRDLGLRDKELQQAIKVGYHPKTIDQKWKAMKRFLKPDGGFSGRFMAAAGKWGERFAKIIPGFYVADQALGLFSKEKPEHPRPAWYNIPGHMAGMVKFGISFAPIDLAFTGAIRLFTYRKAAMAAAAQAGVRRYPKSRDLFVQATEKVRVIGSGVTRGVSHAWSRRRQAEMPGLGEILRSVKKGKAPYGMDLPKMVREVIAEAKKEHRPRFRLETELDNILSSLGGHPDPGLLGVLSRDEGVKQAFGEVLEKYTRRPKQTFIEYSLKTPKDPRGWAPRTVSTLTYIEKFAESAGWTKTTTQDVKRLIGRKELYYGKNILRKGDFSMFNAGFAAEKFIDTIGKWKLPGIDWRPFERMMYAGVPWLGIPGKTGAFNVFDSKSSITMAGTQHGMTGITRAPELRRGDYFVHVGDNLFQVTPEKMFGQVTGPLKVKSEFITRGERRYLTGLVDQSRTQEKRTWWGKVTQKLELGRSPHFALGRLKNYFLQDFSEHSPHVLMREGGPYRKLLDKSGWTPEEIEKVFTRTRALVGHLYGGESTAMGILNKNKGLRGKILDVLGDTEAARVVNDPNIRNVLAPLNDVVNYTIKDSYMRRNLQGLTKAMGEVRSHMGELDAFIKNRGSVVGQAGDVTIEEYLRGQYFRMRLEAFNTVKFPGNIFDKVVDTVEGSTLKATEKTRVQGLLMNMDLTPKLELALQNMNKLAATESIKSLVGPKASALGRIFQPDYRNWQEAIKINRFMKDNLIPLETRGWSGTSNQIFLVQPRSQRTASWYSPTPGIFDTIKADARKVFGLEPELQEVAFEPYVTKAALRLHRYAIRPFNMTLGWIGLDLHYRSNAEFLKKFFWKRALALPAAIFGYRAMDTFLAANPLLDQTIFDDGLTTAGAQLIGAANIARNELFDVAGATGAAQYLEGLFPGSIESPLAKLARGAALPVVGRMVAGGKGLMVGLGISALTGFGLPDMTRTADDLRAVYSGEEKIPVRSSRFWETCCAATTYISTYNGIKEAKDVRIGDKVLTYTGESGTVQKIAIRPKTNEEKTYRLETEMLPFDVELTGNHELYTYRDGEEWVPIEQIDPESDFMIKPFHKRAYTRKNLWLPNILDCSEIWGENETLYPMQFKSCWSKSTTNGIPKSIPLTKEFGRLIGYYLGDGNIFNNIGKAYGIEFCFDAHETHYVEDVKQIIKNLFGLDVTIRNKMSGELAKRGCWIVRAFHPILAQLFLTLFGREKNVPEFMYDIKGQGFHRGVIEGLWESDGSVSKSRGIVSIAITLVNPNIILYLFDSLAQLNILSVVYEKTPQKDTEQIQYTLRIPRKYHTKFWKNIHLVKEKHTDQGKAQKPSWYSSFIKDEKIYLKVRSVTETSYEGDVYDFQIDKNYSYCSPSVTLHNSKLPYTGGRISSFQPSWFTKIMSQYRYTDDALGTKLEALLYRGPISALTDPYHYSKKHFWDRPYPATAGLFNDVPVLGPMMNATIGQILKPEKMMHEEELAAAQMGMDSEMQGRILPGFDQATLPPLHTTRPGYYAPRTTIKPTSLTNLFGESFYRTTEAAGLRGFMAQSFLQREGPGQYTPVYEDAAAITSFGHQFWDAQLGGGIISEAWRRLYPRERFRNLVNPLRNLSPTWLPQDFKFGDPATKIPGGLFLLPSRARETMYEVRHTFPTDIEFFGYGPSEAAGRMLKIIRPESAELYHHTYMKELIQKNLMMQGRLISKDMPVFDPWNKIEGVADAIIMNNTGQPEVMQIKATTAEALGDMQQPKPAHVAQLNFLLLHLKKRYGRIMYMAADNPELNRSFYVEHSAERLRNDMARLGEAREIASGMLSKGIGNVGEAYSYPDRLEVLANAAPYSLEYKRTLSQIKKLERFGMLDEEDLVKVQRARRQHDAIMQKFEFHEYRFAKGKWLTPDPDYNIMNQNTNIKAAAEYSIIERMAGAAWEKISHFPFPVIHSKFLPYYSSEEMYERQVAGAFCIKENTLLKTIGGYKSAKDIEVGEKILTKNGDYNKVLNVLPKPISTTPNKDKIVKIRVYGVPKHHSIEITPEHEIYGKRQSSIPCGYLTNILTLVSKEPKWDEAGSFIVGDYLAYPRFKLQDPIDHILISDFITKTNVGYDEEFLYMKVGKNHSGKIRTKTRNLIRLEPDLYRLFGYYLAEGWVRPSGEMGFAFHKKETEYHKDVISLMEKYFGVTMRLHKQGENGVQITCGNAVVGNFLAVLLGKNSHEKNIHPILLKASIDNLKELMKGYFFGDACLTRTKISVTSVSLNLLLTIRDILTYFGIWGVLYYYPPQDGWIINHWCHNKETYHLNYHGYETRIIMNVLFGTKKDYLKARLDYFVDREYMYLKILEIEHSIYDGIVYDFTVENEHNYCFIGAILHNSGNWSRPVSDYLRPWWNSFLLSQGPLEASAKLGFAGALFGGPPGLAMGVAGGAIYGGARMLTGPGSFVPREVRQMREMDEHFDALEYIKGMRLYQETGDPDYLSQARSTIYGITPTSTPSEFYRAVPYAERPFFWTFAALTDRNAQDRIRKRVSPTMKALLDFYWSGEKTFTNPQMSDYNPNMTIPGEDWIGWREDVPLEDIQVKTVRQEGLDCFVPTQKILTLDGAVEIQDVDRDTELINALGDLKTPIRLFKKFHKGKMVKLTFKGTYFDLIGTETHELEIAKKCRGFEFRGHKLQDARRYNRLKLYSYEFPETCEKLDDFDITEDLGFILGWFLAEGNYIYNGEKHPKGIAFSLNVNEHYIANQLASKIKLIFGCNTSIHERNSSTTGNPYLQIYSYSTKMAQFIYKLIAPNAKTTYLHRIVFKFPIPVLREILCQWFNGDGWVTDKEICVGTASERLAIQCWYIMRSCGMEVLLQKAKQYGYKPGFIYRIRIGRKKDKELFHQQWIHVPWTTLTVSKVKYIDYEGEIFDIEMPGNHYYTTLCGTVHNSHDFGLGWKPQELRMRNSPYTLRPLDISSSDGVTPDVVNLDSMQIKSFIKNALGKYGIEDINVSVTKSQGKGAYINLNIR